MVFSAQNPYPRYVQRPERQDWDDFRRAQKAHREAWIDLCNEWKRNYRSGATEEIRRKAGESLNYSRLRIELNESVQPIYRFFNSLLTDKVQS